MSNKCDAYLMPFTMDPGPRAGDTYCSYCSKDGEFAFDVTLKEFQEMCYKGMLEKGMSKWKAKFFTYCIKFAPHWKKKS